MEPHHTNTTKLPLPHIYELDGLRGVLALWVAVTHILCWCGLAVWSGHLPRPIAGLWGEFIFAQPAVDTFIILSGFAISHLIHARRQTYLQFMQGRFFRIYPVYLICLALGFLTMTLIPVVIKNASWNGTVYFLWQQTHSTNELAHPLQHLVAHLTLLFGVVPKEILPEATATLLTPAWSISLEWQYYLLAPLIARMVCYPAGVLVLALIACGGTLYSSHWLNPHCAFLPPQLPLFLIGIGSYHLHSRAAQNSAITHAAYIVASVLAAIFMVGWHWVALTLWALIFGGLFCRHEDEFSKIIQLLRRGLRHPLTQWLGKISYPVYLVHWPLIILMLAALLHGWPGIAARPAALLLLLFGLPVILTAAWLLHKTIEAPMMRVGKRFAAVKLR
jgi:peptidoglycan/LPS O-acetylase OafA/YrhL